MVENGRIKEDMEDMGGRRMILSNLKIKKLYFYIIIKNNII